MACLLFLCVLVLSCGIARKNPADSHSLHTLLLQYIGLGIMLHKGKQARRHFIKLCCDVRKTQEDLLLSILRENEHTSYGKGKSFVTISSRCQYVANVALTDYNSYEQYIKEILNGHPRILTAQEVIFIGMSSGTTGNRKLLPVTNHMKMFGAKKFGPLMLYTLDKQAGLDLQRSVFLFYRSAARPMGNAELPCGPVTTHMYRHVPFTLAPRAVYDIGVESQAMHVHAVISLADPEVGNIMAVMSPLVYSFWVYVENNWNVLCDDIANGCLAASVGLPCELEKEINFHLAPKPERAKELRREFTRGFQGIARRVWPNLRFVRMLTTGGFATQSRFLARHYMEGVTQCCITHVSTEGFMGINISERATEPQYVAAINYGFMEFIPVAKISCSQPKTLFAEEVIQVYETFIKRHYLPITQV